MEKVKIKKEKIIGILGGMGPYATVDLFKRIVDLTPAKKDWEHLRIIIDNNPKIPSRGRYFAYGEESPAPEMTRTAQNLEKAGADMILIGCLTAHYFYDDVKKSVKVPVISAVEETLKEVKKANIKKIGLLATEATANNNVFQKVFAKGNVKVIIPDEAGLKKTREVIEEIKLGKTSKELKDKLKEIAKILIKQGAEGIILGCSELPILIKENDFSVKVFDAIELMVKKAIKMAKEE